MLVKTAELTGVALDWAVASSKGYSKIALTISGEVREFIKMHSEGYHNYSTDWSQGGPIIEREMIQVWPYMAGMWCAQMMNTDHGQRAGSPLIAAMRCYVTSKLGDEVDIPDEIAR